ncbi:hypothetical protein J6590_031409 [Homalodisca vitripennis]|nr:hypothetical protein J6590_031409 [Homalodisca vitripennis]
MEFNIKLPLDNESSIRSNESQVLLTALDLDSSGRYRCEVSAEAPSFQTVSDHADMVTVALPSRGPVITGGRPRYNIGDTVNVNCTSGSSKPAAHLAWFINGDQVNSSYLRGPVRAPEGDEGLETTTLGLQFQVDARHFHKGDMKLKCLATIATVYWNSNEESVEGEKPYKPPVMEVKDTSRADRVQAALIFFGVRRLKMRTSPRTLGDVHKHKGHEGVCSTAIYYTISVIQRNLLEKCRGLLITFLREKPTCVSKENLSDVTRSDALTRYKLEQ